VHIHMKFVHRCEPSGDELCRTVMVEAGARERWSRPVRASHGEAVLARTQDDDTIGDSGVGTQGGSQGLSG
jgi:hypothetical protein